MPDSVNRIIVDASTAQRAAQDVQKAESAVLKLRGGMGDLVRTGLTLAAGYMSAQGVVAALRHSVDQAVAAEAAQAKLRQAMGRTSQELLDFASARQQVTKFDDDGTVAAMAGIAAFIKEESQIKALTIAAQDFAEAKGMDLVSAAELLAKTAGSEVNALGRYGIAVTGAARSTERLEQVTAGVAKLFGGQAAAAAETMAGKLAMAKNASDDAAQALGELLAPAVEYVADAVREAAEFWGAWLNDLQGPKQDNLTVLSSKVEEARTSLEAMAQGWNNTKLNTLIRNEDVDGLTEMARQFRAMGSPEAANAVSALAVALREEALAVEKAVAAETKRAGAVALTAEQLAKLKAERWAAIEAEVQQIHVTQEANDRRAEGFRLEEDAASMREQELYDVETLAEAYRLLAEAEDKWLANQNDAAQKAGERVRNLQDIKEANMALAAQTLGSMASLNQAAKGNAIATKALAIGETLISTKLAAMRALAFPPGPPATLPSYYMTLGLGALNVAQIAMQKFARGGDFMTSGPQLIMVGDNPGGRERVQVTPQSSPNFNGPQGGVVININAAYVDSEAVPRLAAEVERRMARGLA